MRAAKWVTQLLAALRRDTPAFAPAAPPGRLGSFARAWSAISRDSTAFGGRLNPPRARPTWQRAADADVQIASTARGMAATALDPSRAARGANEMRPETLRSAIDVVTSDMRMRGSAGAPASTSTLDFPGPGTNPTLTLRRVSATLGLLDVKHLTDGDSSLLALWERHAVLFAIEGPDDEILVIRTRPHATAPAELSGLAYRAVNEWNHSHRFLKAYVGDLTEQGRLPFYAEWQIPLTSGVQEALLLEILNTAHTVAAEFTGWLYGEGGVLT